MNDETWLDCLDHELHAAGVSPENRASARVETEGFLQEAGGSALEHFGPPTTYASHLADALGGRSRPQRPRTAAPVVSVDGVSKSYRSRPVLNDVSLTVSPGDVVVLTGPNGAGKSTLLRIIAGLDRADRGQVTVEGAVGYVPQRGGVDPHLRPGEHFELFGAPLGLTRRQARSEGNRLARELGWDAAAAPVAGALSGGTAQKLAVVTALLRQPQTLLLDEPYQGMDADSQQRLWALLWAWQEGGGSAVVSSHASDALSKASTVVEIEGSTLR
ncbi:MAG: ABC transporter ATP-binding protein [Actinomycetota bacterium]